MNSNDPSSKIGPSKPPVLVSIPTLIKIPFDKINHSKLKTIIFHKIHETTQEFVVIQVFPNQMIKIIFFLLVKDFQYIS